MALAPLAFVTWRRISAALLESAIMKKLLAIIVTVFPLCALAPAIEFAHFAHAQLVEFDDGCGHQFRGYGRVNKALADFLEH